MVVEEYCWALTGNAAVVLGRNLDLNWTPLCVHIQSIPISEKFDLLRTFRAGSACIYHEMYLKLSEHSALLKGRLKADSHIACRAHAVPLHAVPLRV